MTELVLLAPLAGWAAPIEETPDPVFAERMLGDGVAIDPTGSMLHAPCAGEVIGLHRAGHAVTLRSPQGAEILMHIGLETVALEGRGFEVHVREGQSVAVGDSLVSFDLDVLARGARSLVSPVVIINSERFAVTSRQQGRSIAVGEPLMTLRARAPAAEDAPSAQVAKASRTLAIPLVNGIHARPAAAIAATAKRYVAQMSVAVGGRQANARSPVALMALGVRRGEEVVLSAGGPDAEAAIKALADLILHGLDEPGEAAAAAPQARAAAPPVASRRLHGVTAAAGLAIGVAARLHAPDVAIEDESAGAAEEARRLEEALGRVRVHIARLADRGPAEQRGVLGAHLAFLEDPELLDRAQALIEGGRSAGRAWKLAVDASIDLLGAADDPRIAERVDDLVDLQRQVLLSLCGGTQVAPSLPQGAILLAEDLLPSQLLGLDPRCLAGFCTARGGPTSHVAIVAASMNIPALVAVGSGVMAVAEGTRVILDADQGVLDAAPTPDALDAAGRALEAARRRRLAARAIGDEPCVMADGRRVEVMANLGSLGDAQAAVEAGAEGCGLLRTEFLFLDRDTPPDEAEQAACYQAFADVLGDRPLVVRTLDVGGDKPVAYLPMVAEENPALGLRGVRVSLAQPELLRTQLRALLRVRSAAPLRIMAPMVASLAELRAVRASLEEVRAEMGSAASVRLGVMVETPAAAVTADLICADAEFISLGTNDLAQYTLAMDRGNPALAMAVDSLHPGVLRLMATAAEGARSRGRPASVCGGLASDLAAAPILIGLGYFSLSAVPAIVPELKALIRGLTEADCVAVAREALGLASAADVRALGTQSVARQREDRGAA